MSFSWKDVGQLVGKAAPIVGTLLGGPVGGEVGSLVASALGVQPDAGSVMDALSKNPDALAKVIEVQTNAKMQLQQLQVQAMTAMQAAETAQYVAEANDRDSARRMAESKPADWWIRPLVVILLLLGATAIIVFMFVPGTREVLHDANATGMLGLVFGYWFSELKTALAFYFGATSDASASAKKITDFATSPGTVTSADKQ